MKIKMILPALAKTLSIMQAIALIGVSGGAVVSMGLVLHAGRNNNSVLLVTLFVFWVLSPFIALLVVNVVTNSWSVITRVALYPLMIVLTLGSLISYSGVSPPGTKPAAVFLVVPLISWLLIAIVILITRSLSRSREV